MFIIEFIIEPGRSIEAVYIRLQMKLVDDIPQGIRLYGLVVGLFLPIFPLLKGESGENIQFVMAVIEVELLVMARPMRLGPLCTGVYS